MSVPWDAVAVTAVVVAIAACPIFALAQRLQRLAGRWRAGRRARIGTARFMKGLDLDLALEQLLVEEGVYDEPDDDLMLLADEVDDSGDLSRWYRP